MAISDTYLRFLGDRTGIILLPKGRMGEVLERYFGRILYATIPPRITIFVLM